MILADVRELGGMNRNTYDTINRDPGMTFMTKCLSENEGRDRFDITHAVAMRCLTELMDLGLTGRQAATAVNETFDFLYHRVAVLIGRPTRFKVGNWLVVTDYSGGSYGWQMADSFDRVLATDGAIFERTGRLKMVGVSVSECLLKVRKASIDRPKLTMSFQENLEDEQL